MYQNPKLSQKSNQIIARRKAVVAFQKKALLIAVLFIISAMILLGSTIITFAKGSNDNRQVITQYSSIQIEKGDTLWRIASENTNSFDVSVKDYIDQVKNINNLSSDDIHSGQYLIVPVYHYE